MKPLKPLVLGLGLLAAAVGVFSQSTEGIYNLVKRRLRNHVDSFEFSLVDEGTSDSKIPKNAEFVVSTTPEGKVRVEGNSLSALSSGLSKYLTDVVHVDIHWFIGNRLDQAPTELPALTEPLRGSSVVPWKYHFNTVTFSYTAAWWTWEDWELELDWLALRGVNLPLASVGQEKVLIDVFREIGFTDEEISSFLSGPAFQAWNRFGNIQGSWGGSIPFEWIDDQFELQKKIVARMVELGMTPVLPAFTGYVPRAITRVLPDAAVVNGSNWSDIWAVKHSNVTFLQPFDENFAKLQKSFISKQIEAYGPVSNIYALDQYNENIPPSGDIDYLRDISRQTMKSLKDADPDAIWLTQGWLFFHYVDFWTLDRVEAYLSGVEKNEDILILDLFAESHPQWQRFKSYFGKPWIWCQVQNFGGILGFHGQVQNLTIDAIDALNNAESMVGVGLTMEGQEGNEAVYTLLLDQAWSKEPLDVEEYFNSWVTRRYTGAKSIPDGLYRSWQTIQKSAYNAEPIENIVYAYGPRVQLSTPSLDAEHLVEYDHKAMVQAWLLMNEAAQEEPSLWTNPAYRHDMLDVTREVLENSFNPMYDRLVEAYTSSEDGSPDSVRKIGKEMLTLFSALDRVLSTDKNFSLETWIGAARAQANGNETTAAFMEYNARNQITHWGPNAEITDYAAKAWGGMYGTYYLRRWEIFVEYLAVTKPADYDQEGFVKLVKGFENVWQWEEWDATGGTTGMEDLSEVLNDVVAEWPDVFSE